MADAPGIKIEGLNRAFALMRLVDANIDKEVRASMRKRALPVLTAARARSPRRSGRLAGSGRLVVPRGAKPTVKVRFGGKRAPYAGVVMFGRRVPHPHAGHVRAHVRSNTPRPFLITTVRQFAPAVREAIIRDVDAALQRVAVKAAQLPAKRES